MTKHEARSLVTVLALAAAASAWACTSESPMTDQGGEGGTEASGGTGAGGKTGGSGGKTGSGGSASGGSAAGGSASGGSAAGGAATGGSSAGGSGDGGSAAGGSAAGGSGAGGSAEGGSGAGGSGAGGSGAGGPFTITVDGIMMGNRLCFKPEASNSGGNHSPKIDWTTPPPGTKSLVLTMYDQTNMTPHRVVCNIMPTVTGQQADVKMMVPDGAQVSTGHNKTGNPWYGPGAGGAAHSYEIAIWALSTPMLEGGCGTSTAAATRAVLAKLRGGSPTLVLAHDAKVLWGNVDGKCM
jgi:phosphatidylethanolamine-binding protein (PEBP) family uncharacterized protein